jgi:hypothetical protein
MSKFVKDMLTDINNENYDVARVLCLLSFTIYFLLAILDVVFSRHSWSAMDFAGGIGTMAVGFGINFKLAQPK